MLLGLKGFALSQSTGSNSSRCENVPDTRSAEHPNQRHFKFRLKAEFKFNAAYVNIFEQSCLSVDAKKNNFKL